MQKNWKWWQYVQSITAGQTNTDIATTTGISKSAVTNWSKGSGADPRFVIAFARAYRRPILEALAASGVIDSNEASDVKIYRATTADLTNRELIAELERRLTYTEESPTINHRHLRAASHDPGGAEEGDGEP